MARPDIARQRLYQVLAGGQIASSRELISMGFSPSLISRMEASGELQKQAYGLYSLASDWTGDRLGPVAARFGGKIDKPFGVVCLQAAAVLHGLTDMAMDQVERIEIAVHADDTTRTSGLPVRIIRLDAARHEYDELQWHKASGRGIHVSNPSRTVCDLFAPWSGPLGEGMAVEALRRLMDKDMDAAVEAVRKAKELGWGRTMSSTFSILRTGMEVGEHHPEEQNDLGGGMTL